MKKCLSRYSIIGVFHIAKLESWLQMEKSYLFILFLTSLSNMLRCPDF